MSEEWLDQLRAGNFDVVVGKFESETLECKRQPYRLETEKDKFELVKDVSGLANSRGGVLLIGFTTERESAYGDDRIKESRPFPLDCFDPAQYRQVISSWTWPKLDVDIEVVPSPTDAARGVAIISITAVTESLHPVLTTGIIDEASGRRIDKVVGLFERARSQTRSADVRQLHAWIVAGRRYEALLREELGAIKTAILTLQPQELITPVADEQETSGRISLALTAGKLRSPYFLLIGVPSRRLDLHSLIESRDSRLSKLVSDPPKLRESGFNIDAGEALIAAGKSRRAVLSESNVLELYRDGFALFAVRGDQDGLCWAMAKRGLGELLINPRVLVEMTYLFMRFLSEAYRDDVPENEPFRVSFELNFGEVGEARFKLQVRTGVQEAASWSLRATVTATRAESAERVAFLVLMEIYAQFGIDGDQIPFAIERNGVKVVDPDQIKDPSVRI